MSLNVIYIFLNNALGFILYFNRFTSTWMRIMMPITLTLIWLKELSEMEAERIGQRIERVATVIT